MMTAFISVLLFAFGLIFGSFLNVVIFRYHPDRSLFAAGPLGGRSHCRSCNAQLAWYELIPVVSFAIQRARCRHCGAPLSWQYPLVELLTGFIFLTPLYFYDAHATVFSLWTGGIWTVAFASFLVLAAIDYYWFIIPDELNIFIAALGAVRIAVEYYFHTFGAFAGSFIGSYAELFGLRGDVLTNHIAGALFGLALIGVIIAVTRGRGMGVGDLKLAGALGVLFGWPDVIFVLAFGFVLGSLYAVGVLVRRSKGMKDSVPFGPFLVAGATALVFYGHAILTWYFGIFLS
ncbi:MAG: prepilin peptidase [Patescibacteria group bacterium]|nr:prepilin peptidase [Patescibacteria group bacterium]